MNNHRKMKLVETLEDHLFSLEKFSAGDTRRLEGDGAIFRWYIAGEGRLRTKFKTLKEVELWSEGLRN